MKSPVESPTFDNTQRAVQIQETDVWYHISAQEISASDSASFDMIAAEQQTSRMILLPMVLIQRSIMSDWKKVLSRLRDKGFTLNEDKCVFHMPKLTFMGLVLSQQGVGPTEEKR